MVEFSIRLLKIFLTLDVYRYGFVLGWFLVFQTRFLHVALVTLELYLQTRLALNSEKSPPTLPTPPTPPPAKQTFHVSKDTQKSEKTIQHGGMCSQSQHFGGLGRISKQSELHSETPQTHLKTKTKSSKNKKCYQRSICSSYSGGVTGSGDSRCTEDKKMQVKTLRAQSRIQSLKSGWLLNLLFSESHRIWPRLGAYNTQQQAVRVSDWVTWLSM